MSDTYRGTVQRSGKFWAIQVDDVGATQARHLGEAEPMTRDLISLLREVPADSFDLELTILLPGSAVRAGAGAQAAGLRPPGRR